MYNLSMSHNSTTKAVLPTQVLITNGDSLKNCPEKRVGYRTANRLGYRTANRLGNGAKNQASHGAKNRLVNQAKNQTGKRVVKTSELSGQMETATQPGVTWLVVVFTLIYKLYNIPMSVKYLLSGDPGPRARGATGVSTSTITYISSSWVWLAGIAAKVWPVLQVVVACSTSLPGSTPTPPKTRRAG